MEKIIEDLSGVVAFFALVIFLIAFYALLTGSTRSAPAPRRVAMPVAAMPIAYALMQLTPLVEWLLYRMNLRRHQRIRAFLQLADDLRMRKQRVDGFLPHRPRG